MLINLNLDPKLDVLMKFRGKRKREKEKAKNFATTSLQEKKTFNPSKKKFQIDPKEEKSLLKIIHYLIKT